MASRISIEYFDGVNAYVSPVLAKKTEPFHAENARSPVVGAMEKREGTVRIGEDETATTNVGLFYFENSGTLTTTTSTSTSSSTSTSTTHT